MRGTAAARDADGMTLTATTTRLDEIAARADARRDTSEVRFAASMPSRGLAWSWSAPGAHEPYFVASITKLATAAIVFQHVDEGRYALDTPVRELIAPEVVDSLPIAGDAPVAVEHLLAHTSGIPDYFEGAKDPGARMLTRILEHDVGWTQEEAFELARAQRPTRAPGAEGRARYSDTNYQLLEAVIEATDGASYAAAVRRRVCEPLGLHRTYVFTHADLGRYDEIAPVLYGDRTLRIPRAMASVGADGGIVSTVDEQVALGEAFMGGGLFSQAMLERATARWRKMFFPLEYGIGVMRFRMPRALNPVRPMPPFVGHSGATGAVLFHDPRRGLTIAGTVNQLKDRPLAFRVLARLERALR